MCTCCLEKPLLRREAFFIIVLRIVCVVSLMEPLGTVLFMSRRAKYRCSMPHSLTIAIPSTPITSNPKNVLTRIPFRPSIFWIPSSNQGLGLGRWGSLPPSQLIQMVDAALQWRCSEEAICQQIRGRAGQDMADGICIHCTTDSTVVQCMQRTRIHFHCTVAQMIHACMYAQDCMQAHTLWHWRCIADR